MKDSSVLDISEVAKASGLPTSTLRYYDEKGLIHSVGRHGLRRLFAAKVLDRLEFIALGRLAGFSLEEIAGMFTSKGSYDIDRDQLLARAEDIDRNIKQLTAVRDGLVHAAHCSAETHSECPSFQRLLKLAGKTQGRKRGQA